MSASILHVCVNYKNENETDEFIKAIHQRNKSLVDVIIVNNSPIKAEVESFLSRWRSLPHTQVLNPQENLGYFGAFRAAILSGRPQSYRWIIFSNTDLEFLDSHFYEKLEKFPEDKTLGALAPSIVSSHDGQDSNPYLKQRPSLKRMRFYSWVFSYRITAALYQGLALFKKKALTYRQRQASASGSPLYFGHGSCIILHRHYFDSNGSLDHPSFLYGEEIFLGEEMLRLGLKVKYAPELKLLHREHGSIGLRGVLWNSQIFKYRRDTARALVALFERVENSKK